ncbi:MAG: hypothetical protein JNM25_01785 [Planctomycetes bacterium]|nr:hypothetical protein [Planctomycetota bacterium]
MKHLSRLTIAILGLSLAAAAQTSVLPYLPKDTIIAVSAPDLATSVQRFQQMPLAKMWAEEEVQNFVADLEAMVHGKIEALLQQGREMHEQGQLPVDPDQVMKLRMRGVTMALTHLELAKGDFGPEPRIGFVLHLDFGETAPQWNSLVQLGIGMLEGQAGEQVTKTDATVGEWPMTTLTPNRVKNSPMGLTMVTLPEGLLIGTLADEVRAIAENLQKKTPALGTADSFAAAAKQVSTAGAELTAFMRYDPMVDFALSVLRMATETNDDMAMVDMDGVDRAVTAMGLRHLPTEISTTSYVDGKSVSRSFRANAGAADATSAAPTVDTAFLKWVPKDAVGFSAGAVDVMSVYDALLKGLQAYDPELAVQALAHLAEMEKQVGFRVRDDLFGSLGDHYVTWSMPMGTISSAPEMAVLMKVRDEQKLVNALKAMAQMSNGMVELEESEKRGLKVYQLRVNFDPTQGMGGMNPFDMFTPTFSFKGGYLVGGFSASDIKRVFQRMDREDDPKGDIRSNREFAAVADKLPAAVDSLSFTDWKAQFESIYQIATGLLAFVPIGEEVPLDMSLLPDSASLTKHLFGSLSYSRSVPGGHESQTISPFGPEVMMFSVLVGGAGAAFLGATRTSRF